MRSRTTTTVAVSVLALLLASGCTSSSSVEDIVPRPAAEITNSIAKPADPVRAAVTVDEVQQAIADEPAVEAQTVVVIAEPAQKHEPTVDAVALVQSAGAPRAVAAIAGAIQPHKFRDAKPINFGKISPRKLAVHGVDVSRWQGQINWPKLRSQGANFAYIKATDGGDHLDPMFKTNWRKAGEAGLRRGAYHFFYWCRTAGEQADWFIRNVPRVEGALPPVIDVEWNGESRCKRRPSPATVREKMQVFMDRLERHYGQRPIIYTAPDFYADNLKGQFLDYPFWLRSVAAHPSVRYPSRKWVFWQYSGSGLSHGVDGRIDLNVFYGSENDWRKWVGRVAG